MTPDTLKFTYAADVPSSADHGLPEAETKRAVCTALELAKALTYAAKVVDVHTTCFKNDGEDTFCLTIEVTMEVRR